MGGKEGAPLQAREATLLVEKVPPWEAPLDWIECARHAPSAFHCCIATVCTALREVVRRGRQRVAAFQKSWHATLARCKPRRPFYGAFARRYEDLKTQLAEAQAQAELESDELEFQRAAAALAVARGAGGAGAKAGATRGGAAAEQVGGSFAGAAWWAALPLPAGPAGLGRCCGNAGQACGHSRAGSSTRPW